MERERVVRLATDIAVGAVAAWALKQVGIKQGTIVAMVGTILIHEMLDAPLAAHLEEII